MDTTAKIGENRLRVVPPSLSPSCVTRTKTARCKRPREILGTRHVLSLPKEFARPFFLAVFFRVTHDGLSERGTTRSLGKIKLPIIFSHCIVCLTLPLMILSIVISSNSLQSESPFSTSPLVTVGPSKCKNKETLLTALELLGENRAAKIKNS